MMIIGCDLHTRYQQIAMVDTETGELVERRLEHESGEARAFYAGLKGAVRVGIEATGHTAWFEALLAELGHELWMGDAAKIRAARCPTHRALCDVWASPPTGCVNGPYSIFSQLPVPNFARRCSSGRGFGENIATLVLACARVTFNPNPFDIMTCAGRVKPLPEVRVDDQARLILPFGLPAIARPIAPLPSMDPFGNSVYDVSAV
jgi:hypothetical protein